VPAYPVVLVPHFCRSLLPDQLVKHLVLWEGRAGRMLRGQTYRMTYVKQLLRNSCCETVDELQRMMKNRVEWARVSHTTSSSEWLRSLRKWMDGSSAVAAIRNTASNMIQQDNATTHRDALNQWNASMHQIWFLATKQMSCGSIWSAYRPVWNNMCIKARQINTSNIFNDCSHILSTSMTSKHEMTVSSIYFFGISSNYELCHIYLAARYAMLPHLQFLGCV